MLPFEEMPQLVNPPSGFVVNTNNEPTGLEYDNDALNQRRRSNPDAIYYLGFAHRVASHLRAGRATQLIEARLAAGETVSFDDMARFHGDVRQLDAELLVPHLLEAWDRAVRAGAPAALADLATDPRLEEAIGRLAAWDYTAPTGIPEGYDASDVDGENHPDEEVSAEEIASSVAATLYNVWRAQVVEDVIVARLADFGLANTGLTSFGFRDIFDKRNLKALHHLLSRDPYTGVGASGIDFFPEPVALGADDRRDAALLRALQATLDALASDTYAAAFARSEDQDDYRWGKLSRVTLRHPASPTRSVPPAGGFANLSPQLPGIPRDGAFQTLNRGTPDAAASGANGFEVTIGSVYRWVLAPGHPDAWRDGVLALSSLAGGTSGDADSPHYADRLAKWLTADFDVVPFDPHAIDWFTERTEDFLPPRSDDP